MAICLSDKEIFSIYLKEVTIGKLYQFFLNGNNIDNILVVFDENNDFYGTCTYGLVLQAAGDLDKCILKEKVCISETFWHDAKVIFRKRKSLKYLPVFNENNKLAYFCYNDDNLDVFLKEIYEIQICKEWMILEAISPLLQAICFMDFNEVAYRFYQLAITRNIPVITIGEKWEAFSIVNSIDALDLYPDFSVLFIQSRNNINYQQSNDWRQVKSIDNNYDCIHQIFFINALSLAILQGMKINESVNNIIEVKDILLKRMQENQFSIDIIFASADKRISYASFKEILTIEEFVRFVFTLKRTWKKKIAVTYGNCQTQVIGDFLVDTDKFMEEYFMLKLPAICDIQEEIGQEYWPNEIVKCFDLLIYQVIKKSNVYSEKAATAYLITKVKSDCKLICITNAYFNGYFPQLNHSVEYSEKYTMGIMQNRGVGLFKFVDNEIIKKYIKCGDINQVIECLKDEDYYSGSEKMVVDNLNNSFKELEKREQICDVKILDYIKENYKRLRLFSEPIHPSNELLIEITKRLLKYLGIENYNIKKNHQQELLSTVNVLIYPSVRKILDLEFCVEKYNFNRLFNKQEVSFDEYVELFIRNCIKM